MLFINTEESEEILTVLWSVFKAIRQCEVPAYP